MKTVGVYTRVSSEEQDAENQMLATLKDRFAKLMKQGMGPKEMIAAAPMLAIGLGQPKPGFMNQSRWLKGLARRFAGHFRGRQATKLLVNQRQQLLRRLGIAGPNRVQDLSHLFRFRLHESYSRPSPSLRGGAHQLG